MKRSVLLVLAMAMVLSLTGCYTAQMLDKDALPPDEAPPTCGEASSEHAPQWGITMEARDVTPTGMTLVIRQEGGVEVTGEITTGTPYGLKMRDGDTWVDVPLLREDIAWNTIAYPVPLGGEIQQNLDWSWMYGTLPAGEYKLVKGFMDFRGTGDYDEATFEMTFVMA